MLPDQLSIAELATGNALVEGATFMAILIGTIAGGQLVAGSSHMGWVSLTVVLLALLSWGFAARIPDTTPSAPDLAITVNPWTSTSHLLKALYAEPRLWDGMVIVSWFWLVGAVVLSLLPALVKDIVGGSEGVVTLWSRHLYADRHCRRLVDCRAFQSCAPKSGVGAGRRHHHGSYRHRPRLGHPANRPRDRYFACGVCDFVRRIARC